MGAPVRYRCAHPWSVFATQLDRWPARWACAGQRLDRGAEAAMVKRSISSFICGSLVGLVTGGFLGCRCPGGSDELDCLGGDAMGARIGVSPNG